MASWLHPLNVFHPEFKPLAEDRRRAYLYGTWAQEAPTVSDLKVTKERVVAAAAKCGDAARVLKELFPEAFAPKPLRLGDGVLTVDGMTGVIARVGGNYEDKAFYLSTNFNWSFKFDSESQLVLVPERKT